MGVSEHEVDIDIVAAHLFEELVLVEDHSLGVPATHDVEHLVIEGLDPHGEAVDALVQIGLDPVGGDGLRIHLDGDLAVVGDIEVCSDCLHDAGHLVGCQEGWRPTADVDGIDRVCLFWMESELLDQGIDVAVDGLVLFGEGIGQEAAVVALHLAEGDVDI